MVKMLFFLLVLARFSEAKFNSSTKAIQQKIECFDGLNGEGSSEIFIDAITDLDKYGWDDRISSCCATGTWILYAESNFNNDQIGAASYWIYGDQICLNLPDGFGGEVSSLRFAGSRADWCFDSLNLYNGRYFSGAESVWVFHDISKLDKVPVESLIVNGGSAWTLYEEENYLGDSVCLLPNIAGGCSPQVYVEIPSLVRVSSARKGCFSHTVL